MRYALVKEDVIVVLSGMSTMDQALENTRTSNEALPFTEEEKAALDQAMKIYKESAPIKQSVIDLNKGLSYHGVPVSAILQAYSICQIQRIPASRTIITI